jgi:hypothetical protein
MRRTVMKVISFKHENYFRETCLGLLHSSQLQRPVLSLEYFLHVVSFEGLPSDVEFGLQRFLSTADILCELYPIFSTIHDTYVRKLPEHGFFGAFQSIMKLLHQPQHLNPRQTVWLLYIVGLGFCEQSFNRSNKLSVGRHGCLQKINGRDLPEVATRNSQLATEVSDRYLSTFSGSQPERNVDGR